LIKKKQRNSEIKSHQLSTSRRPVYNQSIAFTPGINLSVFRMKITSLKKDKTEVFD